MCIVLMCSLRSQVLMIGMQTDRQPLNATVPFFLHCFANNFGVAKGFSFSECQAAPTLIRLPEHTLIHSAECMTRQTGRQQARTQKSCGSILNLWECMGRGTGDFTLNCESSRFSSCNMGLLSTLSILQFPRTVPYDMCIQKVSFWADTYCFTI